MLQPLNSLVWSLFVFMVAFYQLVHRFELVKIHKLLLCKVHLVLSSYEMLENASQMFVFVLSQFTYFFLNSRFSYPVPKLFLRGQP